MPDVYASIETADEAVQERLAEVLELRAADAAQQAMLEDYLADLPLPDGARVLEVGCGTGAVARTLAVRPGVGEVVGIDPVAGLRRARARDRRGRRRTCPTWWAAGPRCRSTTAPSTRSSSTPSLSHIPDAGGGAGARRRA